MSTRAVIAKPMGDGFEGTYHHSDGYPSGLGLTLLKAYHEVYNKNEHIMIAALVEGESVGWSTINGCDLTKPPEWVEFEERYARRLDETDRMGPQSYTMRGETGERRITHDDSEDCEWAYVIMGMGLGVWVPSGFNQPWQPVTVVVWGDTDTMSGLEESIR